jgi:hypothetical protein
MPIAVAPMATAAVVKNALRLKDDCSVMEAV